MLTLAELQSTLQIEYELQLEAMDERTLRGLLADPIALNALVPAFMSFTEGRRIAEATLVQLLARKPPSVEPVIPQEAARGNLRSRAPMRKAAPASVSSTRR